MRRIYDKYGTTAKSTSSRQRLWSVLVKVGTIIAFPPALTYIIECKKKWQFILLMIIAFLIYGIEIWGGGIIGKGDGSNTSTGVIV